MNAKEFVQIVKKMFSKGLTPEEKIKLADEGPVCRLLLRQWDKFFGTSDRKSTRLNSSHSRKSRMPSSA